MRYIKSFLLVMIPLTVTLTAGAQNTDTGKSSLKGYSIGTYINETGKPIRSDKIHMNSLHDDYGTKSDSRMEELDRQMEERKWATEQEAWDRACTLDSKAAYQKYAALYPTGYHRGDADRRIIDLEVEEVLNGEYDELPAMKCVAEDEDSPTSIIRIHNVTGYPLTVYYSGKDSKSIVIRPDGEGTVVLKNGFYRIAASVPDTRVRPFAGDGNLSGGRYETGFCIVYGK